MPVLREMYANTLSFGRHNVANSFRTRHWCIFVPRMFEMLQYKDSPCKNNIYKNKCLLRWKAVGQYWISAMCKRSSKGWWFGTATFDGPWFVVKTSQKRASSQNSKPAGLHNILVESSSRFLKSFQGKGSVYMAILTRSLHEQAAPSLIAFLTISLINSL